jgi:hypothetical protein
MEQKIIDALRGGLCSGVDLGGYSPGMNTGREMIPGKATERMKYVFYDCRGN